MRRGTRRLWSQLLFLGAISLLTPAAAPAQVVADVTFGAPGPVGAGTDPTGQPATYLISGDLGEQRGGNLFHSFSEFSVGSGETATFTDEGLHFDRDHIHHVFARVTGENESQVDGTIRSTIDQADVWLMNPNGVVFGDGARLDVPGGFHASTANWLDFDTGEKFEVQLGGTIPIMEVAAPTEFGFLGLGTITVAGDLLVPSSEVFQLRAAEIITSGKVGDDADADVVIGQNAQIEAPNGRITIGTDASSVVVQGTLSTSAEDGLSAGSLAIRGRSVVIGETGLVTADALALPEDRSIETSAGDIEISSSEGNVSLFGSVSASTAQGGGRSYITTPGDVTITAADRLVIAGSVHADGNATFGEGGRIDLSGAGVSVGGDVSASSKESYAGSIRVAALSGDLEVETGGVIAADADGNAGKSGEVALDARGDVNVQGIVSAAGEGDGSVSIVADGDVDVVAGALLDARGGLRDGGVVTISSRNAGTIRFGGEIDVFGSSAGAVTLRTDGEIEITGRIDAEFIDSASIGTVEVSADRIEMRHASISASAGGVFLSATEEIVLIGSEVRASASQGEDGGSIEVRVESGRLALRASSIAAEGFDDRAAGSIEIDADSVWLEDGSRILVRALNTSGGSVTLAVKDDLRLVDSDITADVGTGTGGNVVIDPVYVILDASSITATAGVGKGGEISITTQAFIANPQSVVDASSKQGPEFDGNVEINAPDVDLAGSLAQLPEAVLDASALAAQRCSARRTGETEGSFVVSGRDAAAPGPDGLLPASSGSPTTSLLAGIETACR